LKIRENKKISKNNVVFENEFTLRDIYKNIPTPIQVWQKTSNDFVLLDYNVAANELVQGKLKNLVGITASKLFKDNLHVLKDLNKCYETKTPIVKQLEYSFQPANMTKVFSVKYIYVNPNIILGYH
jgi:hypothetical protein